MAWWNKLFGSDDPGRVDYYEEGRDLLGDGKYHEALTSFRLALKDRPGDEGVLQHIAIAYTRIGMTDEAAKTYRHVLQKNPSSPGAHYGLGFLLLRAGREDDAREHLRAFLANAPSDTASGEHVAHARSTLAKLEGAVAGGPDDDGA